MCSIAESWRSSNLSRRIGILHNCMELEISSRMICLCASPKVSTVWWTSSASRDKKKERFKSLLDNLDVRILESSRMKLEKLRRLLRSKRQSWSRRFNLWSSSKSISCSRVLRASKKDWLISLTWSAKSNPTKRPHLTSRVTTTKRKRRRRPRSERNQRDEHAKIQEIDNSLL